MLRLRLKGEAKGGETAMKKCGSGSASTLDATCKGPGSFGTGLLNSSIIMSPQRREEMHHHLPRVRPNGDQGSKIQQLGASVQ